MEEGYSMEEHQVLAICYSREAAPPGLNHRNTAATAAAMQLAADIVEHRKQ